MIDWTVLDADQCEILETYPNTDGEFSLRIRHPDAGRPKIFLKSVAGNWYWFAPKPKYSGELRTGYIIKDLDLSTINGAWAGLKCAICGRPLKLTKFGYVHAETGKAYWERPDGKDDHCARPKWGNGK